MSAIIDIPYGSCDSSGCSEEDRWSTSDNVTFEIGYGFGSADGDGHTSGHGEGDGYAMGRGNLKGPSC